MAKNKYYQMYNGFNSNLLDDDDIIEAKTGAEACRELLKRLKIDYTHIKREAGNYVRIKAEPFRYGEHGGKYRNGAVSWFTVYKGRSILS